MEWIKLTHDNLPRIGSWILITDGIDWHKVIVISNFEFAEHPTDRYVYSEGITHWCEVIFP